jgi:hypothetical protein
MHEWIPMFSSGLVILVIAAISLTELVNWNKVRSIGTDFFGERMWKLIEHNLTLAGAAFVATAVGFILNSEKWSPGYITGLVMLFVGWVFFALSIQRTKFFATRPYEKTKKYLTFAAIGGVLAILFFRLPSKAVQPISETKPPIIVIPPAPPPVPVQVPRSYLVFDGTARFGERRDRLGQLVADQNLLVGQELFFNYYYKATGPNAVLVDGTARLTKVAPDSSPATQQNVIKDFKAELRKELKDHPIKPKYSTLMPQDNDHWDSAHAWTEDKKHQIITQPDLDALTAGTGIAFVLVEISYKDNNTLHHLRTCQFLQPPATAPGTWHYCDDFTNPD